MSDQDSLFTEPGASAHPDSAPKNPTPFSKPTTADVDLAAQLRMAQRQISNLLLILLVVSGTLAIYLLQLVWYARADMTLLQGQTQQLQQARQVIASYNQQTVPAMKKFVEQLEEYSKTHPDVLPVLAKYGLVQKNLSAPGTAPSQAP